jgi:hypothetical protein
VGWFPTESITEDFLLSLKLAAEGYDVCIRDRNSHT